MNTQHPIWSERWRLAALEKDDFIKAGLIAVIVGLAFILIHVLAGWSTFGNEHFRSALAWMLAIWMDPVSFGGADYSHGWLIPLVSIWLVWRKRKVLREAPKSVSYLGLGVVVGALLMHWVGARGDQARLCLFSTISLLWGIPFYFYGWPVAKQLIFPCAYLVFCIPLNFLDSLTFPLRLFAAMISTNLLNGLGIEALRSGSAIYSARPGEFSFDVADPCSGIRSMLAMTALTAIYAYLTQKTMFKKWALFLASIPLAIAGNIARIVTIVLVALSFGEKLAAGLYHDYSGYIFFPVAILLMVAIGNLLNVDYRNAWRHFKAYLLEKNEPAPSGVRR